MLCWAPLTPPFCVTRCVGLFYVNNRGREEEEEVESKVVYRVREPC